MIGRRPLLLGAAAAAVAGAAGVGGGVLRLHATPRRYPLLEAAHLDALAADPPPRPRALFIGNSLLLHHDVPGQVAALAAENGVRLGVATAAARGARLIETLRVPDLDAILGLGWDAVVLQDISTAPFRSVDRRGSALAVARIAGAVAPAPVLLYPPFPALPGTRIYRDAGVLARPPASPKDHAARTMAHYASLGHAVAPVPGEWLAAMDSGARLHAADGHHAGPEGAALVAEVLWNGLRDLMAG